MLNKRLRREEKKIVPQAHTEALGHRRIKRQKGRQRSSLIFWLFDAARGGGRGYCEIKF